MANLAAHVMQLYDDLGKCEGDVDLPVRAVFNKLLETAKTQQPDDAFIQSIAPLGETISAASLRALVGQLKRSLT